MRKFVCVAFVLAGFAISGAVSSAEINHELKFLFLEVEDSPNSTVDVHSFEYAYFFGKLDGYYGPYAEMEFLGRNNKVAFSHQRIRVSNPPEETTLSGKVFLGNNRKYGLGFSRSTIDFGTGDYSDLLELEFMMNLTRPSRLSFHFSQFTDDESGVEDVSTMVLGASYKEIYKLRRQTFLNLDFLAGISQTEIVDVWPGTTENLDIIFTTLVMDYYFNRKLSIGFKLYNEFSPSLDAYDVIQQRLFGLEHFINKSVFYQLQFGQTIIDSSTYNNVGIGFGFRW